MLSFNVYFGKFFKPVLAAVHKIINLDLSNKNEGL